MKNSPIPSESNSFHTTDPSTKLWKRWQPRSPYPTNVFVRETIQRLYQSQIHPQTKLVWNFEYWSEVIKIWLPSLNALLAASFILLLGTLQWFEVSQKVKTLSAFQWQQGLTQPLSKFSLAGSYFPHLKERVN